MKILLVDDDSGIRTSLTEFLTDLGYDVSECENGLQAKEYIQDNVVHTILSDIRMPEMDGHELLKYIKSNDKFQNIVVVLYTGYGDIKSAIEAMKNGAYDYLLKPINIEELAAIISRVNDLLALREENIKLNRNFKQSVDIATKDMKEELISLRRAYAREFANSEIGIFSQGFEGVIDTARKMHNNKDVAVLVEGETGTGKEVVARFIHFGDGKEVEPFVAVNCAAIAPNLFESELFGYEAGAFTGGNPKGQKGKIESAGEGTIFLDEISELPIEYQAKLLRVIQEREYFRVGGLKKHKTDARFVCSTNQDVRKMVDDGIFREDLYYRLSVGHVRIPSLRERREEILSLANMFLDQLYKVKRSTFSRISDEAGSILQSYNWPGNVRQLKSVIERIALLWEGDEIKADHVRNILGDKNSVSKSTPKINNSSLNGLELPENGLVLDNLILDIVSKALEFQNGNKTDTAKYLGISRKVLYTYLKHIEKSSVH